MAYTVNSDVSSLRLVNIEEKNLNAEPFASDLCVVSSDISIPGIDTSKADGAGSVSYTHLMYRTDHSDFLYRFSEYPVKCCGRLSDRSHAGRDQ